MKHKSIKNCTNNTPSPCGEGWGGAFCVALWLIVTALFVGLRTEHIVLAIGILALFFASGVTRRLVVALVPFFLFGISYDWMNILPNYKVNPIDVAGIYEAEKSLFGIVTAAGVLTPNEFFALHTTPVADILAGLFYLCWVPLPVIYGLYLYFSGKENAYVRFAIAFLLVNLCGFAIYYIHPAAPPWYVALHGFTPVVGTPGEVAGLGAFDRMTGLTIFHGLYARNANVFAAVPSLHSAYTFMAFLYAVRTRSPKPWIITLAIVSVGIWATAVYTSHHYIIDVLSGIALTIVVFTAFEIMASKIKPLRNFIQRYAKYIK